MKSGTENTKPKGVIMDYQEALAYIHSHRRFGAKPGLERMRALLTLLGNPQEQLSCVHIAGTNGKGSTVAMIASVLRAAGYKTGMYISPYVLEYRERIQVNGEMIPQDALVRLVERIQPFAEQAGELTEFELNTALAFCWFAEQGCGIVVLETGLGGRFDATNVIQHPLLCVITSIGLDHTEILGDTLAQIAAEKCGICKPGVRTVVSARQAPEAFEIIRQHVVGRNGAVMVSVSDVELEQTLATAQMRISGSEISLNGLKLHLPLAGEHQILNAWTAFTALHELSKKGFPKAAQASALRSGLESVRFPVRIETVCTDPLTILDGAHNPQGAQTLARALEMLGETPVTGVMGVLSDKDSAGALDALAPRFRRLICVTPDNPRALDAHDLAARADALGLQSSAAHTLEEGLALAQAVAKSERGAVVVCGSLYLAAQARKLLLKKEADGCG